MTDTPRPDSPRLVCSCLVREDDDEWERHDEDCAFRRAMEAIMENGYPA